MRRGRTIELDVMSGKRHTRNPIGGYDALLSYLKEALVRGNVLRWVMKYGM